MKQNVIDLIDYRNQTKAPQPSSANSELGEAINELIQRLREGNPIS